ncbi:uncharacterized protein LOC119442353 [Dermacentor silvarum]|uniref:uncharacterized protein LOC119442353 n=1 Tax=Dermacentor silvarum TaxID=543639 RepID=UPI002100BD60|nr:uncharacterized protein LOC119442353 [Dermacentor silvarum]
MCIAQDTMRAFFAAAGLFLMFVVTATDACGGRIEALSGTITSPSFPNWYPPSMNCIWEIVKPSIQYPTTLKFTEFSLERNKDCDYDYVEILSVMDNGTSWNHGRFCDDSLPPIIISKGNTLRIEFKSDASVQHSGFVADFSTAASFRYVEAPQLTSLTHPNGSLLFSWTWIKAPSPELAGYYLRGTSKDHNFQTTLSPLLSGYRADYLKEYTEYNITLQPFYNVKGLPKLGIPTQLIVRTPAAAPGEPMYIVRQSPSRIEQDDARQLAVTILEPVSWNSSPVGFRLRWEPNEQGNETARDFDLPLDVPERKKDLNVTLSLKPGREYTLFASARGVGDSGEVLLGPETSVTMETAPLAPTNLSAKSIDPTSVIISWHAASPTQRFVIHRSFEAPLRACEVGLCPYDDNLFTDDRYSVDGTRLETSTVVLDGSSQESSSYSLPLFNLLSSAKYTVNVMACGVELCSSKTNMTFTTPPSAISTPVITTILSNDSSSLYLAGNITLPSNTPELNPEFNVRVKTNGFYRLVHTVEKTIRIADLSSGTEYEVEVLLCLERTPGKRECGRPAKATISTWPLAANC